MKIYDLTAPICLGEDGVGIPKPKSAEMVLKTIGHDLILSGMRIFRYLSNTICFDFHMGTHFDVPPMFSYESFDPVNVPIEFFVRETVVLDTQDLDQKKSLRLSDIKSKVDEELFKHRPKDKRPALILRTGYSRYWCTDNTRYMRFPGLSKDLVEYIAYELDPPFIGIDAISVDRTIEYRSLSLYPEVDEDFINLLREQEYTPFLNHDILLRKNILILENLYLNDLPTSVDKGLILAIPLFRYVYTGARKRHIITAIPCRVLFITPTPSSKEIIEQLHLLETIVSSMNVW